MSDRLLPRKAPYGPGKTFNGQCGAAAELELERAFYARFLKGSSFMQTIYKERLRKEKRLGKQ